MLVCKETRLLARLRCIRSISGVTALTLLIAPATAQAQVTSRPVTPIRIVVLEGEGSRNDIQTGVVTPPVVRVEDSTGRAITGAMVVFTTPSNGASAVFPDGTRSLIMHTESRGEAVARGLHASSVEGPFQIRVEATYEGARASAIINQINFRPGTSMVGQKKPRSKALLILLGGGAAAAVALGLGRSSGGGSGGGGGTPPPPIPTITAGSVTVGGPPR